MVPSAQKSQQIRDHQNGRKKKNATELKSWKKCEYIGFTTFDWRAGGGGEMWIEYDGINSKLINQSW